MKNLASRKFIHLGIFSLLFLTCAAFSETKAQQSEEGMKTRIVELTDKIVSAPNNADLYAERGNLYFNLGKTSEATADAEKALQINAQNGDATLLRGRLRYGRKDYDGAIADYSRILKANPGKYPFVYFQRGEMYEEKGDYERALADFSKTLEIEPRAATMVGKARARVETKIKDVADYFDESPTVKKSVEPESEFDKIAREEGIVISDEEKAKNKKDAALMVEGLLKPGNLEKTVDALKKINAAPSAQNKMTELYFTKRNISKKFGEFQTAYAKPLGDSQKIEMLYRIKSEYQTALTEAENAEKQNLNFSAEQKNQIAEYKTYYSKALGLLNGMTADKQPISAKTGESFQNRADQSNKQNPELSALTAKLNIQIAADPNNDNLYALRAKEYLRLKKYDEALADSNKAVQINPKSTNALILRGLVKTEKKDYDGAIADFTQSIKLAPNQGYAYIGRGTAYERKDDLDQAIADYTKAAEVDPKTAQTANNKRISADNLNRINKVFGYSKDPYSKAYKQFETESDALGDKIGDMNLKRTFNRSLTPAQQIQQLQELFPLYQKQRDVNVRALAELPKFNDPLWERVHKKFFVDNLAAIDKSIEANRRVIKTLEQEIK